jgi:hypothetical protein
LTGQIDSAEPREFLHFRYSEVAPGFWAAYRNFSGFDELETIIKAHLCLYGLMATLVEDGLKKVLNAPMR